MPLLFLGPQLPHSVACILKCGMRTQRKLSVACIAYKFLASVAKIHTFSNSSETAKI